MGKSLVSCFFLRHSVHMIEITVISRDALEDFRVSYGELLCMSSVTDETFSLTIAAAFKFPSAKHVSMPRQY